MSSLSQMLERRRAADGAGTECHNMEAQPACLIATTGAGESWIFPWTQLAAAHFTRTADRETLTLVFASYEVRVTGSNLAAVRDMVAALQLARIRPAPSKFRKSDTEPFLESIHVAPHKPQGSQLGKAASFQA